MFLIIFENELTFVGHFGWRRLQEKGPCDVPFNNILILSNEHSVIKSEFHNCLFIFAFRDLVKPCNLQLNTITLCIFLILKSFIKPTATNKLANDLFD